jgi:hypothetical protein
LVSDTGKVRALRIFRSRELGKVLGHKREDTLRPEWIA